MKCQKCGFDNPKGSKFCNQCGTPLIISSIEGDHLHLAQSHIPRELRKKISSLRIEGERKNVTVLFADISGFTALSEKLDPEEVTELINRCFKVLIDVIYKYEGTIDKFIGDCIMALFGAPITHEDDPERAVRTSLEIMGALDRFNEEHGTKLSIHIGINSGTVIAGGVGSDLRMDYTVMGDTVNLADRLMEEAKDEILVSESVYKKTNYLFEMRGLESVKVKGKTKRIKPYRVIGIKEIPKHKRGISELYSPLVGREKEFEKIKSALNKVLQGNGVVLTLIGEAGLGKSRTIEEMRKECGEKTVWLSGRSFSYGRTIPFWVILEQIRIYLGVGEFTPEFEAIKRLKRETKRLFGDRTDEYLPYLSLFLSIKVPKNLEKKVKYLDYESLRLQEFVSVKAFFKEIAQNRPLILYFEDVHWIDAESIELLKFLLGGLSDSAVLFLFETRPEKESGLYNIKPYIQKIFKKRYIEIMLKPLKTVDANKLIHNLLRLPSFPRILLSLILEKSEGNPFYIEEIMHSFIDAGILKRKKGLWFVEEDISSFEVPDTVEAVIRSRLDRLPLEAKETMGNASVIGRIFHYCILSYITNLDSIDNAITILERGDFILKKNSSPPTYLISISGDDEEQFTIHNSQLSSDMEYMFKHALIRDVAYKGLLKKKRREIHRKTAEYMEGIFREKIENYYEVLGNHYYHAETFEKSYDYYKKAGDDAKKLYLNNVALGCYTKAIEIHKRILPYEKEKLAELYEKIGDVKVVKAEYDKACKDYKNAFHYYKAIEKKAGIRRKIGNIFFYKGEYDTAISFYEEITEILKKISKSSILSETLIDYAHLLSIGKSDYERAEKMIEEALRKIDEKNEPRIYARGLNNLGSISLRRCDYDKAMKYYQKSLAINEGLNYKKGIGTVANNIGVVYKNKGELDTALKYYKIHLTISEEISDKRGIGMASCNIGNIYKDIGELDTALKYYKIHLTISEEIGDKMGIGLASCNSGNVYFNKGEIDTALKYYERYLAITEEIGDKTGIGLGFCNIGNIYFNKGETDTALKYYEGYLTISEEIGDKRGIGMASCNIGNIYFNKGELDTAMKYYKRYLALTEETGDKNGIGVACLNIGGVYTEIEKFDDAEEYLERSLKILIELGNKRNLPEVYANLSELYTSEGNYRSALKFAEKTISLAEETGVKEQELFALRVMGKALSFKNPEKAVSYLKKSISLSKKQKMKIEMAKSSYELAKILKSSGKKREAKRYLSKSKKIFQKAGAKYWLNKCIIIPVQKITDVQDKKGKRG